MANNRLISVSVKRDVALQASRVSIGKSKFVYVLVADKRLKYPKGRSRIVYIGTTKRGLRRLASSAADHADEILGLHGVRTVVARLVTCQPRQRVKTWRVLERALLLVFRERHGSQPKINIHGKKIRERDEFDYFSRKRLSDVLEEVS